MATKEGYGRFNGFDVQHSLCTSEWCDHFKCSPILRDGLIVCALSFAAEVELVPSPWVGKSNIILYAYCACWY